MGPGAIEISVPVARDGAVTKLWGLGLDVQQTASVQQIAAPSAIWSSRTGEFKERVRCAVRRKRPSQGHVPLKVKSALSPSAPRCVHTTRCAAGDSMARMLFFSHLTYVMVLAYTL